MTDIKDIHTFRKSRGLLLTDEAYYKYIFKKTEKIVCVVLYMLTDGHTDDTNKVVGAVFESAKKTLDAVLATLRYQQSDTSELYTFLQTLIALESHLHLAQAAALLEVDVVDALTMEIHAVARMLRRYLSYERTTVPSLDVRQTSPESSLMSVTRGGKGSRAGGFAPSAPVSVPERSIQSKRHDEERKTRIKDILSRKDQATIKDISEHLPELSEKTIQRELISMVTGGLVVKEGERRWTRYSLVLGA